MHILVHLSLWAEGQTSSAKSWAGIVDPENYIGQVEPGGVIGGVM